jgi:MFS family permease
MTGSPATAGAVGFVGALPYILFQLPAGTVVDRVNRRRMMIACDIGRMAALGSLPLTFWLGHLTLVQVFAVAFVEGTLFVLFRLGEVSAVRLVVPSEQYPTALAQNNIVLTAIWIWAALTSFVGVAANPALLFALLAALAFLGASWNIAGQTIYYRLIPDRLIGRVSSVGSLTAFGALPLGQLAGGLLVQAYGAATAGLIAGAGMILVALLTTAAPSVRRGPELAG